VWLYLRFTLSFREVEDLLAERGLALSYETARRRVLKFGPMSDHSLHIVGQHLQAHLGFDFFESPGQEMGATHPSLESAERTLDGLSADCHALRHVVKPGSHLVEHALVLPALLTCLSGAHRGLSAQVN
jgi:hypothetical protein